MQQVLSYFEWKAEWWLAQENQRQSEDLLVLSGVSAYAHKQASICHCMAARCTRHWLPIMKKHNVVPVWSEKYEAKTTNVGRVESASESDNDNELDKHDDQSDSGDLDVEDIVDFD